MVNVLKLKNKDQGSCKFLTKNILKDFIRTVQELECNFLSSLCNILQTEENPNISK